MLHPVKILGALEVTFRGIDTVVVFYKDKEGYQQDFMKRGAKEVE